MKAKTETKRKKAGKHHFHWMHPVDWMRKEKGSITIFLCLLLMPMVTYATMIVDASRLQAAKSAIAGAGDLTLNAAMSEYEQVLKDMYGLFAGIQNESDLEPALEDYFTRTIEGAIGDGPKVDPTVQSFVQSATDFLLKPKADGTLDFGNLLNMKVENFQICNVSSSAIANPAVMKRQITEYMKYKGPVSLATTLISKLSFLKDSSKQTEVVQQKVEYVTALGDIEQACKDAWDAIGVYNTAAKDFNENVLSNGEYTLARNKAANACLHACLAYLFHEHQPSEEIADEKYFLIENEKTYSERLVSRDFDLSDATMNAKSTEDLYLYLTDLKNALYYILDSSGNTGSQLEQLYSDSIWLDGDQLHYSGGFRETLLDSLNIMNTLRDELAKGDSADYNTVYDGMYSLFSQQWRWTLLDDGLKQKGISIKGLCEEYRHYADVFDRGADIYYHKLEADAQAAKEEQKKAKEEAEAAGEEYTPPDDPNEGKWDEISGYRDEVDKVREALKPDKDSDERSPESQINDLYFQIYSGLAGTYTDAEHYFAKQAKKFLEPIYTKINELDDKMDAVTGSMDAILTAVEKSEGEKQEWNDAIQQTAEGTTRTSFESDYETTTEAIDKVAVQALKDVVTALKKTTKLHTDIIESIKFRSKSVVKDGVPETDTEREKELKDRFANYYKYGCQIYTYSELNWMVVNTFDELPAYDTREFSTLSYAEKVECVVKTAAIYASENFKWKQPDTTKPDDVDNLVEYSMMRMPLPSFNDLKQCGYIDGCKDNTSEKCDEERFYFSLESIVKANEHAPEMSSEASTSVDNVNDMAGQGDSLSVAGEEDETPEDTSDDEDIGETLGDILNKIAEYCKQEKVAHEEAVETSEQLKTDDMKIDKNSDDFTGQGEASSKALGQASSLLSSIASIGTTVVDYAYMEEYFTEMFSCNTDRMALRGSDGPISTLSGVTLNSNTGWYGKEVEYILWGNGDDLNANVTANYAMIYMIRFALNAIYAFTSADIQAFALEVATAIAGWTVIGVPIVQAVITIGLALAESGVDIYKLRKGEDVAIYKNATTFVCSPGGLVKTLTEEVIKDATQAAVSAVEEKANELVSDLADSATEKVAEQLSKIKLKLDDYVKEQTTTMYSTIENMFVTPLLNKIAPIVTELNTTTENAHNLLTTAVNDSFDIVYNKIRDELPEGILKEVALKCYDEVISPRKNELVDVIEGCFTTVDGYTSMESIHNAITGKLDDWKKDIETTIRGELDKWYNKTVEYLETNKDKAVSEIKDYISDQLGELSNQISGAVTDAVSGLADKVGDKIDTASGSGGFTLNYKEYCKIFIFLNIVAHENKMLQRAAALAEANVRVGVDGGTGKDEFDICNAYSMFYIDSDVRMNTLFPWAADVSLDELTQEDGFTLNLSELTKDGLKVHYSGINGY